MSVEQPGSDPVPQNNESNDLLAEVKGLQESLKDKTLDDLKNLEESVDPRAAINELEALVKQEITEEDISEADLHEALLHAADNDKDIAIWLAEELGLDFVKLDSTKGTEEMLGQDDLLPDEADAEDILDELEETAVSVDITTNLGSNQIRFLDAVKGLPGNPKNIQEIAKLISEQVSQSRTEALQEAQESSESENQGFMASIQGLADRFGGGEGQSIMEVVALMGLKEKDIPDSTAGVEQLIQRSIQEMFKEEGDTELLGHYLEHNDGKTPESQAEIDLQIELRESVEEWAHGGDYEKEYVKYLEKGGLLEFGDWAQDNVGGLTRLFGRLTSWLKGLGGGALGFFAPNLMEKLNSAPEGESTSVDEYKALASVQAFEASELFKSQEQIWKDETDTLKDINEYNQIMPRLVPMVGAYPKDMSLEGYNNMMDEKIGGRDNAPSRKDLLEWGRAVNSDESGNLNVSVVPFNVEVESYLQEQQYTIEDDVLTIDATPDKAGGEITFSNVETLNNFATMQVSLDAESQASLKTELENVFTDVKDEIGTLSISSLILLKEWKDDAADLMSRGREWFTDQNILARSETLARLEDPSILENQVADILEVTGDQILYKVENSETITVTIMNGSTPYNVRLERASADSQQWKLEGNPDLLSLEQALIVAKFGARIRMGVDVWDGSFNNYEIFREQGDIRIGVPRRSWSTLGNESDVSKYGFTNPAQIMPLLEAILEKEQEDK